MILITKSRAAIIVLTIIALGLFFLLISNTPTSFGITGYFAGGTGTLADPYQITTCQELQDVNLDYDANYVLNNNIDCDVAPFNTGLGFGPIGYDTNGFNGSLNGNNYNITDLLINRPDENSVGLFGIINTSSDINSVNLVDANVLGDFNVGGLVGLSYGEVTNVSVTGDINALVNAGGVIGWVESGSSVNSVYSGVNVAGSVSGGLIGKLTGDLNNSYSDSNSFAEEGQAGGLVGISTGTITNSYSLGIVASPSSEAGGIVGQIEDSATITNVFSAAQASGVLIGGLAAQVVGGSVTINNSFWDINKSGVSVMCGSGTGCNDANTFGITSQLYEKYVQPTLNWDFNSLGSPTGEWNYRDANYPSLSFQGLGDALNGAGTLADPYQITTCTFLQDMQDRLDGNYILNNNIACSNNSFWDLNKGFKAVGENEVIQFEGSLNGSNYNISNLLINRAPAGSGGSSKGLFGLIKANSDVNNINLIDVNIVALGKAGGLIGRSYGEVNNILVTGTVKGATVGGLIGLSDVGSSINLVYSGVVITGDTVGGLIGSLKGDLNNSYSDSNVSSSSYAAGLVGDLDGGNVRNSYALGDVNGVNTGGLVGRTDGISTITNSFAAVVASSSGYVLRGGLVADQEGGGSLTINNSFWDTTISGLTVMCGSGSGCDDSNGLSSSVNFYRNLLEPVRSWEFPTWDRRDDNYPALELQGYADDPDMIFKLPTTGTQSGTIDVNFEYREGDNNVTTTRIYYSASVGAKTNLIITDTNLHDATTITCDAYTFSDPQICTYKLDTALITNGSYYIDLEVTDGDGTELGSSGLITLSNSTPAPGSPAEIITGGTVPTGNDPGDGGEDDDDDDTGNETGNDTGNNSGNTGTGTESNVVNIIYPTGEERILSTVKRLDEEGNLVDYTKVRVLLNSSEGTDCIEENIPKSVTESASNVVSDLHFRVVQEDPILEFTVGPNAELIYFIKDEVDTQVIHEFSAPIITLTNIDGNCLDPGTVTIGQLGGAINLIAAILIILIIIIAIILYKKLFSKKPKGKIFSKPDQFKETPENPDMTDPPRAEDFL